MSSFCIAKATHIFFSKKFQHIRVSLDVNFNESLTNDIVSFEQLGPGVLNGLIWESQIATALDKCLTPRFIFQRSNKKPYISAGIFRSLPKDQQNRNSFHVSIFVCLNGFYVAFNNPSIISRRCQDVVGSSMLTLIVLPH